MKMKNIYWTFFEINTKRNIFNKKYINLEEITMSVIYPSTEFHNLIFGRYLIEKVVFIFVFFMILRSLNNKRIYA